jgi:hypothetical protein
MSLGRTLNADEHLARQNLDTAVLHFYLQDDKRFSANEKDELRRLLDLLFWKTLPYFRMRPDANPVHHNTQVLDNMVRIALGEGVDYRTLKNASVLALLHDIGNGISEKPKVKTDKIKKLIADAEQAQDTATREKLQKEAIDLAPRAVAFRLEHMEKGPTLVREVTKQSVKERILQGEDVDLICRAVEVHDYPTIEELMKTCRSSGVDTEHAPGVFLLHFDDTPFGLLTTFLREADRLYMVTDQGVVKDLGDKSLPVTEENVKKKRKSNAGRHREEFALYDDVGRGEGFISGTLYRTQTGYRLFRYWEGESNLWNVTTDGQG